MLCYGCCLSGYIANVSERISCKRQNYSFLSNNYSSRALYQTLQTTKLNFEKRLGQPTISIRFNLQVCLSVPTSVFVVLLRLLQCFERLFLCLAQFGGRFSAVARLVLLVGEGGAN